MVMTLISCDKPDYSMRLDEISDVTFNISELNSNATKTSVINRYIVEIYKASDSTVVFRRIEQASDVIVVSLMNNTDYICFFWADAAAPNDNTGTFNSEDLRNVKLNANKSLSNAFSSKLNITDTKTTFNVSLECAMAQMNIITTSIEVASFTNSQ